MATTTYATSGIQKIEWAEGHAWGKVSNLRVNGATEVYPGFCLTSQGNTYPDVSKPDARGDSVYAVAGCNIGHNMDSVYADNAVIVGYLTGSGWGVYPIKKGGTGGGDCVAGEIMVSMGAGDEGFIRSLKKDTAVLIADYTSTVLATTILGYHAIMGRAADTVASAANNAPMRVVLSV